MTAWPSYSLVACLLLASACPADPDPQPADESSTGQTSTGMGPGTMPTPTTTPAESSSTGTPGSTGSTGSTGTSTGPDDTTLGSSSSGGSSSGDPSTSDSSSGDPSTTSGSSSGDPSTSGSSTTAGDPCAAGDGPDFAVTNNGFSDYVINGVNDPPLTVVRGCSYTFNVNAAGHPFFINSVQGTGVGNAYNDGVVGNGTQNGAITWDVPMAAPDALFYNCQFHAPMTGTIAVIDPM